MFWVTSILLQWVCLCIQHIAQLCCNSHSKIKPLNSERKSSHPEDLEVEPQNLEIESLNPEREPPDPEIELPDSEVEPPKPEIKPLDLETEPPDPELTPRSPGIESLGFSFLLQLSLFLLFTYHFPVLTSHFSNSHLLLVPARTFG